MGIYMFSYLDTGKASSFSPGKKEVAVGGGPCIHNVSIGNVRKLSNQGDIHRCKNFSGLKK